MKRYILSMAAALICSVSAWAVMASPEPFEYTKPDGTIVMARMYGDEFHSYIQSLDGELLEGRMDAEAMEEGAMLRRAHRAVQGSGSPAFPPKGSPRSLVLLVSFSDLNMGETLQDFRDLLNKSGYSYNGASGSCRDYYIASSDSIFQPQFDCFGPFKLEHTMEYYGGNSGNSNSQHAAQMVAEACQKAHAAGVNFKDYDINNDGQLDNVFIFFAGHNEAEGGGEKTIWPHASNISYLNVRLDDVLVTSYACTSEYKNATGSTRCGIGTFCHEFGHVIGQPDFYDTKYNYYTVANWDIMSSGSYNNGGNTPPTFSAFERMYEGWLVPTQLLIPGQYTLHAVPFQKEVFLIADKTHNLSGTSPNPNEFFLLEYRSSDDIWDRYLPGHGMLVWHVDYSASAWNNNTPNNGPTLMRMHLEEANGVGWKKRQQGENGRSSDPYPGTANVTSFIPTMHNGTQLEQPVFNITEGNGVIGFTFIGQGGSTLRADKKEIELTTTVSDNKKIVDWDPDYFELLGSGLDPEQPITLKASATTFTLYAGEEAPAMNSNLWRNTISLQAESDSTLQKRVWVNFRPTKKNCSATRANITISSPAASISVSLIGNSPRPTYVKTPEVLPTTEVTPYSFTANWKTVPDAELYYLTLYQKEAGETEFPQGFEDFDDINKIHEAGWESNTTLTTTTAKAEGSRSLYIKNHGDQITTETYPTPIHKISFWYNAFTSPKDTIGVLEMEVLYKGEWILAEQLVITNKAKQKTATYDFLPEDSLCSFRFTWVDNGGSGIAFDAFNAVASEKIVYHYKGRELSLVAYGESAEPSYTFSQLDPASTYFYQVQCTDQGKGCQEHITPLSAPTEVRTMNGAPLDSKQLTIGYDSINYDPAQHAIYLTDPQKGDYLYFYKPDGQLVQSVAVMEDVYIYTLNLNLFTRGEVYMVQHAKNGKLGRKNKRRKFIF